MSGFENFEIIILFNWLFKYIVDYIYVFNCSEELILLFHFRLYFLTLRKTS